MNQHNRTKERQARGSTLTFIARKGICQMPDTGIGRQESLKPTWRSRKSGLRSLVPCSTKSINEDDEEMNTACHAVAAKCQQSYFFFWAAFHLAQRARWAAAIRLRAAADIGLRFPLVVRARTDPRFSPPTPPRAFKAVSNCSSLLCTCALSFSNCRTALVRFSMSPLGQEL